MLNRMQPPGRRTRLWAIVLTPIVAFGALAAVPANADELSSDHQTSQALSAAPLADQVIAASPGEADVVRKAPAGSTSLEQPAAVGNQASLSHFDFAQRAIGLSENDATTFESGISVSRSLSSATVNKSGLTVNVAAEGATADVTVLSDGARIMSLLDEGDSDATFTVELPANTSLVADNEGFLIVGDAGGTKLVLGAIETPWAVDADGTQLATSYTLNGTVLTQHVQTQGAKYPIVADPTITIGLWGASDGPGTYWNMTGAQAKVLGAATVSVLGLSVAGGCVAAGKIPTVGWIVAGVCGFVGMPNLQSTWSVVMNIAASTSMDNWSCYQIKILPAGHGFFKVDGANCA